MLYISTVKYCFLIIFENTFWKLEFYFFYSTSSAYHVRVKQHLSYDSIVLYSSVINRNKR